MGHLLIIGSFLSFLITKWLSSIPISRCRASIIILLIFPAIFISSFCLKRNDIVEDSWDDCDLRSLRFFSRFSLEKIGLFDKSEGIFEKLSFPWKIAFFCFCCKVWSLSAKLKRWSLPLFLMKAPDKTSKQLFSLLDFLVCSLWRICFFFNFLWRPSTSFSRFLFDSKNLEEKNFRKVWKKSLLGLHVESHYLQEFCILVCLGHPLLDLL